MPRAPHREEDAARAFSRPRTSGIIASTCTTTIGWSEWRSRREREIMLVSSGGKAIRFHEDEVRYMGRERPGARHPPGAGQD